MIDPKELRIGNWVEKTQIKYSGLKKLEYQIRNAMDIVSAGSYNPIPLTTEILEKCGFHKQNFAWVPKGHEKKSYTKWDFTIWDEGPGNYYYNSAEFPTPLKSLHQLQNLYWCLVGEELDVKL